MNIHLDKYTRINLVVICLTLAFVTSQGHPLIGQRPQIWSGNAHTPTDSRSVLDIWSITHLIHGSVFLAITTHLSRLTNLRFPQLTFAIILESLWEMYENSPLLLDILHQQGNQYTGDSITNSFSDIAMMMIGFQLAQRFGWKKTTLALSAILLITASFIENTLLEFVFTAARILI